MFVIGNNSKERVMNKAETNLCFFKKYKVLMPLYVLMLCMSNFASAVSVYGKVTHSLSVSSNIYLGESIHVNWSPLSTYSSVNFSFAKLGVRHNGGSWSFTDYRGSGTTISPSQTGTWCFIVRGWDSTANQFGLFGAEQCTTVNNPPVPNNPNTPSGLYYSPINQSYSISWNSVPYAAHYLVNGTVVRANSYSHSYTSYGNKSLVVQACNMLNQCSSGSQKDFYIYTGPGTPNIVNPASSVTNIEEGSSVSFSWGTPGGSVPGIRYKVTKNGETISFSSDKAFSDVLHIAGTYSYSIQAVNPNGLYGGSVNRTVIVSKKEQPLTPPNIEVQYEGKAAYYIPVNKKFSVLWPQVDGATYQLTETYGVQSQIVGNAPLTNIEKARHGKYQYTVAASNSKGSVSAEASVYVYTSPGAPKLQGNHLQLGTNEGFTINWERAGGLIAGAWYEVKRNSELLQKDTKQSYTQALGFSVAGVYQYVISACNPELACTDSTFFVEVTDPVTSPNAPTGTASLVMERNTSTLVDNYYNPSEKLIWNISAVASASYYNVQIKPLAENVNAGLSSHSNLSVIKHRVDLAGNSDGNNVWFNFGQLSSLNQSLTSGQSVSIKLTPCNEHGCSISEQRAYKLVYVAWPEQSAYYEGSPMHIASIAGEVDGTQNFIFNKLWPRNRVQSRPDQNTETFHFYELSATELMDAYMYPYKKENDVYVLDYQHKLFDAVSLWDMAVRVKGNGTLNDTVLPEPHNSFKIVSERHRTREFFDNVFGVKDHLMLKISESNHALKDFKTWHLFKPLGNERSALLDGLHESASQYTGSAPRRGFYLTLQAPKLSCDSQTSCNNEQNARIRELKIYIDEALEQFALFNLYNPNTHVRFAGFKWSAESAAVIDPDKCRIDIAYCGNELNEVLAAVKAHIKHRSEHLELVMSAYSRIHDYAYASEKTFSSMSCQLNNNQRECINKLTTIKASGFEEHFDKIWLQPNAAIQRFDSQKRKVETLVGQDIDYQGVDREILDWYNKGIFQKLEHDDSLDKYSMLIEYTRHGGESKVNDQAMEYGLSLINPNNVDPTHNNYIYESFNGRLDESKGYYGDMSYYFDYIMSEFPASFRNGNKTYAYDDNGGLVYCYATYLAKKPDNKQCDYAALLNAKVVRYNLIESVSDIASLYSFVSATRNGGANYKGDNNLFPDSPLLKLTRGVTKESSRINIAGTGKNQVSVKALVRARLLETEAFKDSVEALTCSEQPSIKVTFYSAQSSALAEREIQLSPAQLKYACMTHERRRAYLDGGKSEQKVIIGGAEAITTSLWTTVDNWELLESAIDIPDGAVTMQIELHTIPVNGVQSNLESYLFYRPEYKVH